MQDLPKYCARCANSCWHSELNGYRPQQPYVQCPKSISESNGKVAHGLLSSLFPDRSFGVDRRRIMRLCTGLEAVYGTLDDPMGKGCLAAERALGISPTADGAEGLAQPQRTL